MRPTKILVDSGTQEIFNMEPKKKLELKPEQLITAPRGNKIQIPKTKPFKLTGEIVQRKNTDMQTEAPKRRQLTDSGSSTLYTQEPKQRKKLTDSGASTLYTQEPKIKTVSNVATEAKIKTPTFKEMVDASKKIKTAVKSKLYSKEYNEFIQEQRAGDKISSAIKAKLYPEKIKELQAVNKTLGPVFKAKRIRNKYLEKVDKKEKNKLNLLEAKTDYIENILKKVDEKHKKNETDKLIQKSIKNNAAITLQKVIRGHASRKENEKTKNREKISSSLVENVIKKSLGKISDQNDEIKPVELFGGTRSGAIIHPEASAPPQPLFGKDIDKSINDNFDKIKAIYSKEPKSYAEVIQANKQINVYKQNINRIKKRNGKSILSADLTVRICTYVCSTYKSTYGLKYVHVCSQLYLQIRATYVQHKA